MLITDHAMPRMTGAELAAAAKTIRPRLPIVLTGGYAGVRQFGHQRLEAVHATRTLGCHRAGVQRLRTMSHPFAAELTARATQIGAKLRAQQDQSDARGCYSDEIHRELLEGGFYRILQPRMFNGGGVDCETYIRVILELSRGHPGGGWCYALASSHALVIGAHFEEEVQRELFERGTFAPRRRRSAGFRPSNVVTEASA